MKLTNEHNCQLFTDLDQLKDNDTSIRTNIERVWFFFLQRHALGSVCLGNGGENNRTDKYAGTDIELV